MTATMSSGGITFPDGSVLSGLYPSNGNSLGYDGYQKFPSGIIYQWGTWNGNLTVVATGGYTSWTTPIKFPTAPLQVVVVPGFTETILTFTGQPQTYFGSDDAVVLSVSWSQQTTTTTISVNIDGLGTSPNVRKLRWFAVGY